MRIKIKEWLVYLPYINNWLFQEPSYSTLVVATLYLISSNITLSINGTTAILIIGSDVNSFNYMPSRTFWHHSK